MTPNPHLAKAVDIFRKLGWDQATIDQATSLPLGTRKQQQAALKGLVDGPLTSWKLIVNAETHQIQQTSYTHVAEQMLILFAIRLGITADRSVQLLHLGPKATLDYTTAFVSVAQQRGATFQRQFFNAANNRRLRFREHSPSAVAEFKVALGLSHSNRYSTEIDHLNQVEYLKDWAALAKRHMIDDSGCAQLNYELFLSSLKPHIEACFDHSVPATGPFSDVVALCVNQGYYPKETAIEQIFSSLESALRPGERKRWAQVLTTEFSITTQEMRKHLATITAVTSLAEPALIDAFALPLIPTIDPDHIIELVLPALYTKSARVLKDVLRALSERKLPAKVRTQLQPRLAELMAHKDPKVSSLATQIVGKRSIQKPTQELYPWHEPPQFQPTPRFTFADPSLENLTNLIGEAMADQHIKLRSIIADEILSVIVTLAHTDLDGVKRAVQGASTNEWLGTIKQWGRRKRPTQGSRDNVFDPFISILDHAHELPCVLSKPSFFDYRIAPADLITRLEHYAEAGVPARVADFVQALLRLDLSLNVESTKSQANTIVVPLLFDDNSPAPITAGELYLNYIVDPLTAAHGKDAYSRTSFLPNSLRDVIGEQVLYLSCATAPIIERNHKLPTPYESSAWERQRQAEGLLWAKESPEPLNALQTTQFLASAETKHPVLGEIAAQCIEHAWKRGILSCNFTELPKQAVNVPISVISLIAENGKLALAWPLIDAILKKNYSPDDTLDSYAAAIAATAADLAPSVIAAIQSGIAPNAAAKVPGLRLLAQRKSTAKAVRSARTVVAAFDKAGLHPESPL